MESTLNNESNAATDQLLRAFRTINPNQLNAVPFEGSWTAGQLAEHVLLSITLANKSLKGNTAPANRDPLEKKFAADMFLNFDVKFQSPDFLKPQDNDHDYQSLLTNLTISTFEFTSYVSQATNLDELRTDFEIPAIGEFTGTEWAWFCINHIKRHTRQLNNIAKALISQAG